MSAAQKTPYSRSAPLLARKQALDLIAQRGQALPGRVVAVSGPIVTVSFEVTGVTLPQVTMPLFGPEYIRYPIQVGDKGVCYPVDTYIGGVSGLGGGTADATLRGNLSTLVWFPIGNKNWTLPSGVDANTLLLYGKTALELLDSFGANASVKLTATALTLTFGFSTITINSSGISLAFGVHSIVIGSSGITMSPGTSIDGKLFLAHEHGGVQSGANNSGPVV